MVLVNNFHTLDLLFIKRYQLKVKFCYSCYKLRETQLGKSSFVVNDDDRKDTRHFGKIICARNFTFDVVTLPVANVNDLPFLKALRLLKNKVNCLRMATKTIFFKFIL